MAEPISTTTTAGALATAALLTLIPGVDAAVVLGAFAGGAVFVISSSDISVSKKAVFFVLSFVAGIVAARGVATFVDWLLPEPVEVSNGVGALIASALAVKALLSLISAADSPEFFQKLRLLKGKEK
ncbi:MULTISPECIES: putative holin [Chromobacterium]|uniref:Phage holin n=1 Tax=Chromobacterium rhizoryzae TaxID=1778675 RepID=A0AAD0RTS2_9NEIS|nr:MULTISPECIES: putative holin [Chromobacterium]AXT47733.1 hypothetical protein D1345_16795 [Chromobacterium rhizoryzae]QOD81613.1 hypothetical protein IEZ30_17125 [Chromobacterium haemolyticum]QOZ83201.1 hypothetical protein DXT74_09070 [Chromobacterium sp. Rain0013]UGA38906.1 phage holin family protein [Chromobacterium haemolyticum]WON83301.1 phage holin family protein [Chromobacterium haemolyticum]